MQINTHLLKCIIKNLPNYIFVKDINSIYTLCNHNFSAVVGDNPIGKNDYELPWSKKIAEIYQEEDNFIISTGKSILDKEVPMLILNEESILSGSKVPLYDENQKVIGILGVYIDITDKKQALILAKEKAEVANQAKTEFLENMRHDIRTPLTGIVGCAQLIRMQADDPKKVLEYADDLVQSSDALLQFLNKILESIQVASGEIPLLKKKFDLHQTLEEVVRLNKPQAVIKNLSLHFDYDKTIPNYLMGDPIRVQRILLELVTNALKFTDEGEIKVIARLMKNKLRLDQVIVKLSVSDTGMGIPLSKHNEVYTRFKRLTPSYKGIYPGTGLGLSVVKQFIDDLGGEIHLISKPNQGSTFTCLIPFQASLLIYDNGLEEPYSFEAHERVVDEKVERACFSQEETEVTGSRVLVVEDNPIATKVAQRVMAKLNCQVDDAPDGKTALGYIEKKHYDLILMDVGLPDNDGCKITRRIRLKEWQRNPTVPIIGLTAHIAAEKKRSCLANGMNAVYTKPLTLKKASEILHAFVRNQQQHLFPSFVSKSFDLLQAIPILDIERGLDLMGSQELLKEGFALLVSDLSKELEELDQHYQANDWSAIRALVHKWKGGAAYCGARRLEQVCQELETALQKKSFAEAKEIYQLLLQITAETKDSAKMSITSDE
ncbi:MAG: ATP-binding protein [Rickettsiella sp.]|nr:ATP-binding protein [Rickettsiella sp.]